MNGGLFGSGILDVAIGLVLVFLVLSIMASALSEAINSALNFRSQGMEQFIRSLFMRPDLAEKYTIGLGRSTMKLLGIYKVEPQPTERYVEHFYNATIVAPTLFGKNRPSYISARDFSLAIFDTVFRVPTEAEMKAHLLTKDATPYDPNADTSAKIDWTGLDFKAWKEAIARLPAHSPLKAVLLSLLNRADNDVEKFRTSVETWFDGAMERVGGWYKRRTQFIILFLGLFVAGVFNVDTIAIANKLLQNPALRQTVAARAASELERLNPTPAIGTADAPISAQQALDNNVNQVIVMEQILTSLNIPIGWNVDTLRDFVEPKNPTQLKATPIVIGLAMQKFLGILITGFAVNQGAPFWFDLLNKLTNIRSVGKAPKETKDDAVKEDKTAG